MATKEELEQFKFNSEYMTQDKHIVSHNPNFYQCVTMDIEIIKDKLVPPPTIIILLKHQRYSKNLKNSEFMDLINLDNSILKNQKNEYLLMKRLCSESNFEPVNDDKNNLKEIDIPSEQTSESSVKLEKIKKLKKKIITSNLNPNSARISRISNSHLKGIIIN